MLAALIYISGKLLATVPCHNAGCAAEDRVALSLVNGLEPMNIVGGAFQAIRRQGLEFFQNGF